MYVFLCAFVNCYLRMRMEISYETLYRLVYV